MTRKTKILVVLLFAPVWLVAFGLTLEWTFRLYDSLARDGAVQRVWAEIQQYRAQDDPLFQKVREASPPPDTVPWKVPERDTLHALDETGRLDLARTRQDLILLCDEDGTISRVYPCEETPELTKISSLVAPGGSIAALLPPAEFADALESIRQAGNEEKPMRDYDVPLGDGSSHFMEFNAMRVSESPVTFALFLGDSRYLEFMRRYRPHVYRRDWYMAQFNQSEFWTNSLGFRDREIELPKPKGRVRIVCVGGSTTVEGPHNDLTYPKLLERMLRAHFSSGNIDVINCGVDGMAFPGELERMGDWLRLEPDLILHYNIINNASWMIMKAMEKALEEGGACQKIKSTAAQSRMVSALYPRRFFPDTDYYVREVKASALSCLEEMHRVGREAGVSMAVASFAIPDPAALSSDERRFFESTFHLTPRRRGDIVELRRLVQVYNALVRELCEREGVLYLPVAEGLSGGIETFADICHLRLPGINRKAEIMFEHLKTFTWERLEAQREAGEQDPRS